MCEVKKPQVFLVSRKWKRKGHCGLVEETSYSIYLNNHRLRGFSTHGDMTEGYLGFSAHAYAESYAADVAGAVGSTVIRVKVKPDFNAPTAAIFNVK